MLENDWRQWDSELEQRVKEWLETESIVKDGDLRCVRCESILLARRVHCSIHDGFRLFHSCCGSGQVHTFDIPECPDEQCPNHRPSFWDAHLQLDNYTLRGPCIDC